MVVASESNLSQEAAEVVKSIANLSMVSARDEKSLHYKRSMADDSTGKSYLMSKTETEEQSLQSKPANVRPLREIKETQKLEQTVEEASEERSDEEQHEAEVKSLKETVEQETMTSMRDSVNVSVEHVDDEPTIEVEPLFSENQLTQLVAIIDTALDKGTRKARKFAQEIMETSLSNVSSFAGYSTFGASFAADLSNESKSANSNNQTE